MVCFDALVDFYRFNGPLRQYFGAKNMSKSVLISGLTEL